MSFAILMISADCDIMRIQIFVESGKMVLNYS